MKISGIEKQKKEKQRCNIFIDGIFSTGLYEDTVVKFGLRSGDEISEKEFEKIREYDEFNYAKTSAYKFLSYRQRSKKEMVTKLKQKKLSEIAINKVIKLLEEQKYLNDENFADNFVKEKIRNKKVGKRTLIGKLLEKGISKEISESIISDNYPAEEEFAVAEKVLAKFVRSGKFKNDYDKKSKCFRHLISKGFDTDTANILLSRRDN
ncbi:MAG: RecX family transcriptional regulator [Ignavibacteria bacterium]|nr:RecX family transcriptional regulator [Ignavibacteria bacterium]